MEFNNHTPPPYYQQVVLSRERPALNNANSQEASGSDARRDNDNFTEGPQRDNQEQSLLIRVSNSDSNPETTPRAAPSRSRSKRRARHNRSDEHRNVNPQSLSQREISNQGQEKDSADTGKKKMIGGLMITGVLLRA